ncbi:hypothetical protein F4678DRAFT_385619 [Xylaria arbuscula]|nr:hypothetical protein F4678DRAFT_385619 [Xylaria arbuscula]
MRELCEKLIFKPLTKLSSSYLKTDVLVIVVDALNECDNEEDVKLLIHLLYHANSSKSARLQILLNQSSRVAYLPWIC